MSTFVKNYYSPKNPAVVFVVSWETGYRDIQIRYNDRLIHTIPLPIVLEKGVKIEDEELGTIKIKFTSDRPKKLVIKVNNRTFKTVNKLAAGYDYVGLITTFTTLALFAVIEAFSLAAIYRFDFSWAPIFYMFVISLIFAVLYGLTVFLLSKKYAWAYFLGTGLFALTTVMCVFDWTFLLNSWANNFVLIIRLAILTYILFQLKPVVKEIRKKTVEKVDDLLDSED